MISHFAHLRASIFLDLTDRVVSEGETGLLNVVFHPEFERNGFFFVFYTLNATRSQGTGLHDRLSRFRVLEGDPDRADITSEIVLLNQFDRHVWHNAGGMAFGPDSYLYLTVETRDRARTRWTTANGSAATSFSACFELTWICVRETCLPSLIRRLWGII